MPLAALNEIYEFGMMERSDMQLSKMLQQLIAEEDTANIKIDCRNKATKKTSVGYFACRPCKKWFSCSFKWCKFFCCM